jgi:hypothetical protein
MRFRISLAVIALMLGLGSAGNASARDIHVVISPEEIRIIREYYTRESQEQPKARAQSGGLPPGIAKNLARGKPLPPGIAKRALPDGLERQLPPPPKGYERVVLDGRVLLVEIATQVIHDVLTDLILR